MKKIYVAGCGGMLGSSIYSIFSNTYQLKCSDKDTNEDWLTYLDFTVYEDYLKDVLAFKPDYLMHLGAFTDLEYCQQNSFETYKNNVMSVENATLISKLLDIPLVYISSAGIFDGEKDYYNDWDVANPINIYGESKYQGENIIKNLLSNYLICRAGWMMGGGVKKDKKFISKILNQIQQGKKELNIVDDKLGTPTYTIDFSKNLELLLSSNFWGTYNMVCEGLTSRYEVTKEILKILNLENEIKINKVKSDFFRKDYFVKRPKSERLLNTKLNLRSLNIMRDWKVCLSEYLINYYD